MQEIFVQIYIRKLFYNKKKANYGICFIKALKILEDCSDLPKIGIVYYILVLVVEFSATDKWGHKMSAQSEHQRSSSEYILVRCGLTVE